MRMHAEEVEIEQSLSPHLDAETRVPSISSGQAAAEHSEPFSNCQKRVVIRPTSGDVTIAPI
jgi:hypothetical protein